MDKNYFYLLGIIFLAGCTQAQNNAQIPNPSATFCIDRGYEYNIRDTFVGQSGFCIFDDGSECEAWAYFRGECAIETASSCKDLCGDGECQEIVCMAIGCPCPESFETCPVDCPNPDV